MRITNWAAVAGLFGTLVFASTAAADVSFSSTTTSWGSETIGSVSGDFNGDGKPDVVVAGRDHTLSYFEGIGDGGFLPPITTDIGALTTDIPSSVVAADFNNDGSLDVAVAYLFTLETGPWGGGVYGSTISVHLSDGAGQFSSGLVLTTGPGPYSVAAGDFDFDGNRDLAIAASDGLWFHLGGGDGTFQSGTRRDLDPLYYPSRVVVANLDGSSQGDDLAMVFSGGIILWPGAGFTHTSPQFVHLGFFINLTFSLGDLNGDGNVDLVVANYDGGYGYFTGWVQTFLGNGQGLFVFRFSVPSPFVGKGVALADFNTDGKLDIVTGINNGFSVFLGDGTGDVSTRYNFAAQYNVNPPGEIFDIEDFDRDGRPDVLVNDGGSFTVLMNTSPRGCVDTLTLEYSAGTLTLGFTIQSVLPTRWSTWIAWQSNFVQLWSVEIPAVPTAVSWSLPMSDVPPVGNIGVLTTMSHPTQGLMCADWKIVDSGGVGATAQTLEHAAATAVPR